MVARLAQVTVDDQVDTAATSLRPTFAKFEQFMRREEPGTIIAQHFEDSFRAIYRNVLSPNERAMHIGSKVALELRHRGMTIGPTGMLRMLPVRSCGRRGGSTRTLPTTRPTASSLHMESEPQKTPAHPAGALPRVAPIKPRAELEQFRSMELAKELLVRLQKNGGLTNFDLELGIANRLSDLLARSLDVHTNRFAPSYVAPLFERLYETVAKELPPIPGSTVVELGCGSWAPLNLSMVFLLLGARKALAFDLDWPQDIPRSVMALADVFTWMITDARRIVGAHPVTRLEVLERISTFNVAGLAAGAAEAIDRTRLQFCNESVADMRSLADGEADLVVSNSFLEHVEDIDSVLAEVRRVTRIGGFGSHGIDATDHRRYGNPNIGELDFLREPAGEAMVHGTNRLRPATIARLFEKHGFEVRLLREIRHCQVEAGDRTGFSEPFRSMPLEQLETTVAHLVVRRRS